MDKNELVRRIEEDIRSAETRIHGEQRYINSQRAALERLKREMSEAKSENTAAPT